MFSNLLGSKSCYEKIKSFIDAILSLRIDFGGCLNRGVSTNVRRGPQKGGNGRVKARSAYNTGDPSRKIPDLPREIKSTMHIYS